MAAGRRAGIRSQVQYIGDRHPNPGSMEQLKLIKKKTKRGLSLVARIRIIRIIRIYLTNTSTLHKLTFPSPPQKWIEAPIISPVIIILLHRPITKRIWSK